MTAWSKSCVCVAALAMLAGPPQSAFAADAAHPTVIELFQSQGCSSCPPAEANVGAVSDRSDVLALAFEVDYWDRLGWKDTFSKAAWTARQYAYARAMGRDGVYTPQVVVNGRVEGDGLEPGGLAGLMSRGDRGAGGPSLGFSGGAVTVGAGAAPAGGADVWLARYIPRTVEITIDDDGPGIAINEREAIFNIGYRSQTCVTQARGSGLGLAVVRRLLERAGGSVRASDSPLGGARMVIALSEQRHVG